MKLSVATLAGVVLLSAAASMPAHATPLTFSFVGTDAFSFQLDSNPTPSNSNSNAFSSQTFFNNVAGTYGGVIGTANINFGTGLAAQFNLSNATLGNLQLSGTTVFTGPSSSPTFAPGVFTLNNPFAAINETLTVSQASAVSSAPEPGTWALLISGVAVLGSMFRVGRLRKRATIAA